MSRMVFRYGFLRRGVFLMGQGILCSMVLGVVGAAWLISCSALKTVDRQEQAGAVEKAQVPTWTPGDMSFHLHGSMSTEFAPEDVLRAFIRTYPDLFPTEDLSHLGLIPDPKFGWPVGLSRGKPAHLGGLSSVGVNCAACHVAEVEQEDGGPAVRILGGISHADVEAFFGSIIASTFRTADPANMKKFLGEYLDQYDPIPDKVGRAARRELFEAEWDRQFVMIRAAMAADPAGARGAGPGGLQAITAESVEINEQLLSGGADLAELTRAMLKLFHNMRAALHVPDEPPTEALPASGPGRNDAFGLLSATLLGVPQPYAPVKFGLVWNVKDRYWVHWDGNTRSPIGRNLLAVTGLGAPLVENEGRLNFSLVKRHTDLTEEIKSPKYPFEIDQESADRGAGLYAASCATCHDGPEGDSRLHSLEEIGTDPSRAELFTQVQADRFNQYLAKLKTPGYKPSKEPGIRGTGKYWSPSLGGVWARSPYLHNGSVRTMWDLLTPAKKRPKTFKRGSRIYDEELLGYTDDGGYVLDTRSRGSSNQGHEYGTGLNEDEKRDLIEYLKTL